MSLRNNNSLNNMMDVEETLTAEERFRNDFDEEKMSTKFAVDKKKKRRRRNKKRQQQRRTNVTLQASLSTMPREILQKIFGYCDRPSLEALKSTLPRFSTIVDEEGLLWETKPKLNLDQLPSELLLTIFSYLSRQDLGRAALVCVRFRDLTHAECLWMAEAKKSLATNGLDPNMILRNLNPLTSRDRVRISKNWSEGNCHETTLLVQSIRYMPRLQLERSALWVGWGNKIWSHPRNEDGTISRTTNRVLKGHTDDVARFVVKDGLVVSGGRDQSLFGWNAQTGDFAFAKRYCHGSEVSAVDVSGGGSIVISGSRDKTVKIWSLVPFNDNNINNSSNNINVRNGNSNNNKNIINNKNNMSSSLPHLVGTVDIGDRIWSLAADPFDCYVVIGSAGLCGVPSLHLLDLNTGVPTLELGHNLKRGAGMLDVAWQTESTFLSCGYDSCTRLWDTRIGNCVR
jgi:F-box/WD-40 domain protein 4